MADDTTDSDSPTGSADDINIIKPPTRATGLDALANFQSQTYQSALQGQKLQRQHRTALAGLGTITLPNDVSNATIPPAAAVYTEADIQVMVNEIAALKQIVAQQSLLWSFLKQTMTDNITKLT